MNKSKLLPKSSHITIYVDVSGQHPQKTYIGAASFNTHLKNEIVKEFDKKFSEIKRKKGTQLSPSECLKVLDFLNANNVVMRYTCIKNEIWENFDKKYNQNSYWIAKIFGIYKFGLIDQILKSGQFSDCHVIFCKDNFLRNHEKVTDICNELKKANNYNFSTSTALQKGCYELKFADYVASSARKLSFSQLTKFTNLYFLECPHNRFFSKIFKK